jgi:hypothetical protein
MAVVLLERVALGGIVKVDTELVREKIFHLADRPGTARKFVKAQHAVARRDSGTVDRRESSFCALIEIMEKRPIDLSSIKAAAAMPRGEGWLTHRN